MLDLTPPRLPSSSGERASEQAKQERKGLGTGPGLEWSGEERRGEERTGRDWNRGQYMIDVWARG